jgi:hypothetical protein
VIKISDNRISIGRRYKTSPEVLWNVITDTDQWPLWGPTVKSVELAERFIRQGSEGRVLTVTGIWLPFVIVEYEHARFWSWKVASVKATGHRIMPAGNEGYSLWFEIPIMAAPYGLVCRMALDRIENLLSESSNLSA